MKTNDMIRMMVEDAPSGMGLSRRMLLSLAAGIVVSAALLLVTVGTRPDMATAIGTLRFLFKTGTMLLLALVSVRLAFAIGRPGMPLRTRSIACLLPAVLLASAVLAELFLLPRQDWAQAAIGTSAAFCLMFIPVLSLAPLAALLLALRHGAPERPSLAGAVAGLAAGGTAAALYAWHCPNDSPLYAAIWYTSAIAIVTATGALIGRRLLRW